MKNVMIAVMFLATVAMTAQRNHRQEEKAPKMSTKERATLATKKATLALALDASQSDKMYPIILAQIEKREAQRNERLAQTERPSKEERIKITNDLLDEKIAMQRKVKSILTEDQFKKWQKMSKHRGNHKKQSKRGNSRRSK